MQGIVNLQKNETSYKFLLIYLAGALIIGYFLGTILWEKINLPFTNPYDIRSFLTNLKFNPTTNLVRYTLFVSLPSALLIGSLFIPDIKKKLFDGIYLSEEDNKVKDEGKGTEKHFSIYLIIFLLLFVTIPLLNHLLVLTELRYIELDIFHEGEQLTAANNYLLKNEIWTGTNFIHGAFYDVFATVWGWRLLGAETIGANRVVIISLSFLSIVALATLILTISSFFKNKLMALASAQIIAFSYLISRNYQFIDRRDSFAFFAVCVLLLSIKLKKYNEFLFFIAGLFSAITFFNTIDRGIYYTVTLLVVGTAFTIFAKNKKAAFIKSVFLLAGVIVGWLIFYLLIGPTEWASFIGNTSMFFSTKDYYDSYVYSTPNIFSLFRPTLPLVITSINLLLFSFLFFAVYRKQSDKRVFLLHLTILLLSIFYFRSGLGRSDAHHISYSSTLIYLCFGLTLSIIVSLVGIKSSILQGTAILLLIFNIVYMIFTYIPYFDRLPLASSMTKELIKLEDVNFLNNRYKLGISRLREIFADEKCYFGFTNQPGMPYLLDKPTCGDTYNPWFNSPKPMRDKLIADLQTYKPGFIIYQIAGETDSVDSFYNKDRMPDVNAYILENYEPYEEVQKNWSVYKLKEK